MLYWPLRATHRTGYAIIGGSAFLLALLGFFVYRRVAPAFRSDPSVAVVPFRDVSPDRDQAYLAEGISEEIRSALTRVPGLRVSGGIPRMGSELNGSVRRTGDRIRVSVQWIDSSSGEVRWSQEFDQPYRNIFGIQDSIVAKISGRLSRQFQPGQIRRHTSDPQVYDFYLQGRHYALQPFPDSTVKAISRFEEALKVEADHSPSLMGLASAYLQSIRLGKEGAGYAGKARKLAGRVLEREPESSEAHRVLCLTDSDRNSAESVCRRAVELDPLNGAAHAAQAAVLLRMGRLEEGQLSALRAEQLDPSNPFHIDTTIQAFHVIEDRKNAFVQLRKLEQLSPKSPLAERWRAILHP